MIPFLNELWDFVAGGCRLRADVLPIVGDTRLELRRSASSPAGVGQWVQPGGALQVGESFKAAALRELREETGIVAYPRELVLVIDGTFLKVYALDLGDRRPAVVLSDEHDAFRWYRFGGAA